MCSGVESKMLSNFKHCKSSLRREIEKESNPIQKSVKRRFSSTSGCVCSCARYLYYLRVPCSVCDDERIVEVKSDSALLRANGADRENPGKV